MTLFLLSWRQNKASYAIGAFDYSLYECEHAILRANSGKPAIVGVRSWQTRASLIHSVQLRVLEPTLFATTGRRYTVTREVWSRHVPYPSSAAQKCPVRLTIQRNRHYGAPRWLADDPRASSSLTLVEPRINFALSAGTASSPCVRAFSLEGIARELEEQAATFCEQSVKLDSSEGRCRVVLPKVQRALLECNTARRLIEYCRDCVSHRVQT